MQILITGGLGFIGSNLVKYFLKNYPDCHIINLDAVTYAGHFENLSDIEGDKRYHFVQGRIEDEKLIDEIVSGRKFGPVHGIINVAAETHVDRSITDPAVFVHTNVLGTQTLLESAFKYGMGGKANANSTIRFAQVSTDEVYGSLGQTGYFTEETPLAPSSPYSSSKAGADMLVRAYFHTYGLPAVITRCSNNYGPYQHPEKLIPLFIKNIMAGKKVPVYGDGMNVRDWLHVEDHCQAIALAFYNGMPGEVYNIGGNNERTNMHITKLILSELGRGEELINYVEDRLGHDRRYAIDSSKIRRELGWNPKYTFEVGIHETIEWYKGNQTWLAAVSKPHHEFAAINVAPVSGLTPAATR
jgi:dTDP-glucose 4,6-dehydratase